MSDVEIPNPADVKEQLKDQFTKRVALTVAVYAVILAIVSLGSNKAGSDQMLNQMQASDQWAFYQAKAIREHMYKLERMNLEVELEAGDSVIRPVALKAAEIHDQVSKEESRYASEKDEIKAKAEAHEAERDFCSRQGPYFDYANVLLQISIVLASVAMLAHSGAVFSISVFCAGLGSVLAVNGFTLWVNVPGFGS